VAVLFHAVAAALWFVPDAGGRAGAGYYWLRGETWGCAVDVLFSAAVAPAVALAQLLVGELVLATKEVRYGVVL
jgi:hypothetical protein